MIISERMQRLAGVITERARTQYWIGDFKGGFNAEPSYAIKINGIDDFESLSIFDRMKELKKIDKWKNGADVKTDRILVTGKSAFAAVKKWVKQKRPSEFFARWHEGDGDIVVFYKP